MYKIQNTTNKNVSLTLERGSVILRPGQYFDLDPHCSRAWIDKSKDLKTYLNRKQVKLTHDSQVGIPTVSVRPAVTAIPVPPPPVKLKFTGRVTPIAREPLAPKVIDLSYVPEEPSIIVTPAVVTKEVLTPAQDGPPSPAVAMEEEPPYTVVNTEDGAVVTDPVEKHLRSVSASNWEDEDEFN